MSELKAIKIELNNHGKPIASVQGTTSYYGISPNDMFYPKPETDKVIALLKDKANYNEYAYKHKSEELADTCRFYEKELRHHKYKRCLTMAQNCEYKQNSLLYYSDVWDWLEKWRKRWLAIADKFKEIKL